MFYLKRHPISQQSKKCVRRGGITPARGTRIQGVRETDVPRGGFWKQRMLLAGKAELMQTTANHTLIRAHGACRFISFQIYNLASCSGVCSDSVEGVCAHMKLNSVKMHVSKEMKTLNIEV